MKIFSQEQTPPHLVGYARISTDDQGAGMQIEALKRAGVDDRDIYYETASGGSTKRDELRRLLREIRPGDVVVVWKLDRLSRQLRDLLALIQLFHRKGAQFRSLTEAVSTEGPLGEFTLQILGAVAQFERALIRQRTKAGIARARERGRPPGRRKTFTDEQITAAMEDRARGVSWAVAARRIGISVTRLQARIRQLARDDEREQRPE